MFGSLLIFEFSFEAGSAMFARLAGPGVSASAHQRQSPPALAGPVSHQACLWRIGGTLGLYRVGHYPTRPFVSHTVIRKAGLSARVRRIRGQVEGIERALEREQGCAQVLHLIAGVRGAIAGLMAEVIEEHVQMHLVDLEKHPDALDPEAARELLLVIRTYLK